jgi:2-dehydro-3-deoxyphosphogluconate aldolase / (4S)-4-hydroxy-2-oxoglutarate aldolase
VTDHRWQLTARIVADRVIGIIRAPSPQAAVTAGRRLAAAGLGAVEVSLSTPAALSAIGELTAAGDGPAPLVGAGTVLDAQQAALAIAAGARFLVCPALSPAVIRTAHRHGVPVVAGAATPTEIIAALEEGADLVKLFPASHSSPGALRDLLRALPQAPLVPTGGVTARSAPEWIAAGAVAVGMGGELTRDGTDLPGLLRRLSRA